MGFIAKTDNIKAKRVQIAIQTLYQAITDLLILEDEAQSLIDESAQISWIANHSQNEGDSLPVLPIGNEKVLNWKTLGFDLTSNTKFIEMLFNEITADYDRNRLDILEPDYKQAGETLPSGTVSLSESNLKLKDGYVIFKNLEKYDFDYTSYEILNEIFRAVKIFLNSVEDFYSQFYQQSVFDFIDHPYNDYDDSAADDRKILVYDTREMDWEIENVIDPLANSIENEENREAVKFRYRLLRDQIKNFAMYTCVERLENDIDNLLLCVNGQKKYDISQNLELRVLTVREDSYGYNRTYQHEEEVFFPFHNKSILHSFTQGLSSVW